MTYLITDRDGHFVNWSDHPLTGDGLFSQRVCDNCVACAVDWQDCGAAELQVQGREGERFCRACRDELVVAIERGVLDAVTIQTVKGNRTGTLEGCWTWQAQHQGAFATLILADGMSVDISTCDTLDEVRAAIAAARE